jgi:(p)ppGpp synthase/HD superfamily hydrolase
MLNNEELIKKVKLYNKFFDPVTLTKAFNFALNAHKDQKRDAGEPYIIHPVAVADILTELKLDSATITTGLLHDTIEDTRATYDSVKKEFGQEVADLVNGVTKISALEEKAAENSMAENLRKLILATSKDIRVLLVKLADRLHNMRTLNSIKDESKKIRKAKETMEIYAPLADRMGMNRIRDELEDLSFSVLNKEARKLILDRLAFIKNKREDLINKVSEKLTELLKANKIDAEITGREKTPFSIWRKMQSKRISLEQLTDIVGFRVILKNINQYKSIHTSVIGPLKKRIEIQIRTESMHEFAERGIASHWKYKSSEKFSELSWKEYDWLKDLVEIIETGGSPEHYFEFTKLQMFQDNVFCFTPQGAVIKLPRGGTPVDFAYAVHTKVGDAAIACEINGNPSALQTSLRNGDMVKIITSKKISPSLHWLSSSKTGKARASIRKHWQGRLLKNEEKAKEYTSTLSIDLPHKPGILGKVSTIIGSNDANIINIELTKRSKEYLRFLFDLQIKDLKNFTNLISQLKQEKLKFEVIRHKKKKYAFIQRVLKNFKRN